MIKCVCGCDPEVCCCAFQEFHVPPPEPYWEEDRLEEDWQDKINDEEVSDHE